MTLPKVRLKPGELAVLTLTEPWATLCVLGEKSFETRGWSTSYRGLLLIQAAKGMPAYAQAACMGQPFADVLANRGLTMPTLRPEDACARTQKLFPFAFGAIIGAVDLVETVRTELLADKLQRLGTPRGHQELAFGDYSAGRWAFRIEKPRRFDTPVQVRGSLGIWPLNAGMDANLRVRDQLGLPAAALA